MARRNGGFIGTDGLDAPDPPTGVTVSGGSDGVASISFTAPTNTGTSAITGFVATASNGVGATGSSSPISVSSLTLGTAVTFRAYAVNVYGTSAASDATDSITPAAARGVIGGGFSASDVRTNVLQYITIGSTGNSTDFGDMTITSTSRGGMASSTRGVYSGGNTSGGKSNVIDYITIASTGNATDFGDASTAHNPNSNGGASSSTRGVFSLGIT
jgi:large repetitive protein